MNNYNEDSIKVLSDIQHVQTRPGMYIGEADNPRQLFYEILDNGLDEYESGEATNPTEVIVDTKLNQYTIRDYGRGIPQGDKLMPDGSYMNVIRVIYTTLRSGGKFDNEGGSYKICTGLHGVGAAVTNALSSSLSVKSIRDGKCVEYSFINGEVISKDTYLSDEPRGTEVSFIPNPKYFQISGVIPTEIIINRCRIASALGIPVNLTIDGESINTNATIFDLMYEDDSSNEFCRTSFRVVDESTGEYAEIAIKYTSELDSHYKGYTNSLYNSSGGSHHKMLDRCIENAWSKYEITDIYPHDVFLGLRAVVAVFINNPNFSSQTKEKLTVAKDSLSKLESLITAKIIEWLDSDEELRKGLITRFKEYRASKNKFLAKKEVRNLIYINDPSSNGSVRRKSVVSKLVECSSKSRDNTELHICEGDSAAGSIVASRNPMYQAVLPIRGKILNVSKMGDIKQCIGNEEVRSIVNASGAGLLEDCNASLSRYDRYIIDTDADADGKNIRALLIALFVNVLPDIVKSGMLYVSDPPLYGWKTKSGYGFCNEKSQIPQGVQSTRYKGLGEMDPDEMKYVLIDPDTRNELIQVQYPNDLGIFNQVLTSSSYKYDLLYELGLIRYSNYEMTKSSVEETANL